MALKGRYVVAMDVREMDYLIAWPTMPRVCPAILIGLLKQ